MFLYIKHPRLIAYREQVIFTYCFSISNLTLFFSIFVILLLLSNETLGKPIGSDIIESDIREFKQTLLYAHIKETDYYKELLNHYGKEEFDIEKVKQLFIDSKSLEYCQNKMNNLYEESLNKLNKIYNYCIFFKIIYNISYGGKIKNEL